MACSSCGNGRKTAKSSGSGLPKKQSRVTTVVFPKMSNGKTPKTNYRDRR